MGVAQSEDIQTPMAPTIEELFAALESPLLAYALRLVRERTVAEDMVQDAFMKLHADFANVREPRPWLYRTVHNAALNHRRQEGRIVSMEWSQHSDDAAGLDWPDPQPLPDEHIARSEGIGLVRLCLETLDARSRDLVRMKFVDGLSYQEMSERMGIKVGHVGYLLHHALKAIATELSRRSDRP